MPRVGGGPAAGGPAAGTLGSSAAEVVTGRR
jgi:hypothetical protein